MTKTRTCLLSVFMLLLLVCAADAATHDVYPGDLIQPVIDNATDGDTILVHPGRYYENINVTQSLDMIGDDADLVAANESASAIYITADHVTLSGFSVTGATNTTSGIYIKYASHATITDNTAYGNYHGIHLQNSSYDLIENNNFDDNILYGIAVINTTDTIIQKNTASNAYYGGIGLLRSCNIALRNNTIINNTHYAGLFMYNGCNNNRIDHNTIRNNDWYGGILVFDNCNDNTITNNDVSNNSGYYGGITLYTNCNANTLAKNNVNNNKGDYSGITFYTNCTDNTITENNINNNTGGYGGITFYRCGPNNVFHGNYVMNNTQYGIRFVYSSGNLIYNNAFASYYNRLEYKGTNTWNITPTAGQNIIGGPQTGGNYWDDYTGTDDNNDGFGDTSYYITMSSSDYYPLVHTNVLCGDVVTDDNIDILDLTSLLNIVVAGDTIDLCVGDTDGNRDLNILDVRRLIMHINDPSGSPLNCGC